MTVYTSRGSALASASQSHDSMEECRMPEAHEPVPAHPVPELSDDEKHLARLGYKQELNRSWSGFSNFAISFSIISILAGCFTTFGQAWNNGGPIAISIRLAPVSVPIPIIGVFLGELGSPYPTPRGLFPGGRPPRGAVLGRGH